VPPGRTAPPLVVVDLRPPSPTGADASDAPERAGLTANKNGVPGDPQPPKITSGLRLGSSAGTARGMGVPEFTQIAHWIADVLESMTSGTTEAVGDGVREGVGEMVSRFPIYPG